MAHFNWFISVNFRRFQFKKQRKVIKFVGIHIVDGKIIIFKFRFENSGIEYFIQSPSRESPLNWSERIFRLWPMIMQVLLWLRSKLDRNYIKLFGQVSGRVGEYIID